MILHYCNLHKKENMIVDHIIEKQLILGFHTSINPSIIDGIYFNEESLGDLPIRTAAQIFLKPPMKVSTTKITEEQIAETKRYIEKNDVYLVVHVQYLLNFIREGSTIQWARKSLIDDLRTLNIFHKIETFGELIKILKKTLVQNFLTKESVRVMFLLLDTTLKQKNHLKNLCLCGTHVLELKI